MNEFINEEFQKLLRDFPTFIYKDEKVSPMCENCIGENCLKQPCLMGLCKNYKFNEAE